MANTTRWKDAIRFEQPWLCAGEFEEFVKELSDNSLRRVFCDVWCISNTSQIIRIAGCVANNSSITHLHISGKLGENGDHTTSYNTMKEIYYLLKKHPSLEVLDLESLKFSVSDTTSMIPVRLMFYTPLHTVILPAVTYPPSHHILQEIEEIKKSKPYFYIGRWDIEWNTLLV